MIKIELSSDKMICNAGAAVALDMLQAISYDTLVNEHLGKRVKLIGYSYSDICKSLFLSQLSGGSCVEDVQQLKLGWEAHPNFKVCSSDTVLRGLSELKTENTLITSESGVQHQFNINTKMNELLLKVALKTNLIHSGTPCTLDYDNVITECEKYDAEYTYKKVLGYQPAVASIGNLPVYIEGRNGNSNARFRMKQTLENCFILLDKHGIEINKFRSDSAAYLQDVIELMKKRSIIFYIRAMASQDLKLHIRSIKEWTTIRYNHLPVELAEVKYAPFGGEEKYRIIVQRKKKTDGQMDAFSQDCYEYHGILTSDTQSTPEEIFGFYNQRGSSEKLFDILKNDFNWNHLPSSFLAENTVYMILSSISCLLFEWLKSIAPKYISGIEQTHRLKQFIYRFVTVAGKWIRTGRQTILKIFSDRRYDLIPVNT
jgi:hypothetical protein